MLGVIDMAARPILAMLKDGTIVAVQMPTVSTAHARLLAIDGMLLGQRQILHTGLLTGRPTYRRITQKPCI